MYRGRYRLAICCIGAWVVIVFALDMYLLYMRSLKDMCSGAQQSSTAIQSYFTTVRPVSDVSCKRILANDEAEISRAKQFMSLHRKKAIPPCAYIAATQSCSVFLKTRGYVLSHMTEEEKDFPIAFSILAYKDIELVERLLRAIYRPQNYYCIHMDMKASTIDKAAIQAIAKCFPNVFLSSRSVDIRWGKFSVLEAELICMRDLWQYKKWRYFINLTGQEFPLKTNLELVKILKEMRGANVVEGMPSRLNTYYRLLLCHTKAPHRIRVVKGSVHVAVNRDFVDFCLHDDRSADFLDWLKCSFVPDEIFFPSINHSPALGIPGTFLGDAVVYPGKPTFTRYKNWEGDRPCHTKHVHYICILGVEDIHRLTHDINLFANKFHLDFEYLGLDCLEELMLNRTRDQYLPNSSIDVSCYGRLDQARLQVKRQA